MNKKICAILTSLTAALILTGCGKTINTDTNVATESRSVSSETESAVISDSSETKETETPKFETTEIKPSRTKYVKFSKTLEAENCVLSGKAKTAKARKGFSGKGYVTSVSNQTDWTAIVKLPESQYYNITITLSSDKQTKSGFAINGSKTSEFTVGSEKGVKANTEKFSEISFNNIYLEKGEIKLSVIPEDAKSLDIDKISITASNEIAALNLTLKNPALVNKNADYNAKALYSYICENYGKKIILGQHDSVGLIAETELINSVTGKYPAIRFGDMTMFTDASYTEDNEIPSALGWAKKGGIVAYMWHWTAPMDGASCYAEETKFDISKAVTKLDVSQKSISELEKLQKDGKISKECLALIKDIDSVSKQLALLRDDGIAVIWRPLHEASNGYFWWGKDVNSYKWLWKLMYERQTNYHKLNNLIWVWSAQNANWYVGDNSCDILSADVYDNGNKAGQINSLLFLRNICKTKPIAMSECGSFPSIQSIADENAKWSFICQWGGNFLMTNEGKLSEGNNTSDELITMYNNNLVITRDDLPDFNHLANDIKKKETAAANKKN